ncbi:MAG TPA: imidazoleglycerol-phosphate dehydratase [bacterium]|nr:imidazoleglycerol-phosphate dehydratase [bacterium]
MKAQRKIERVTKETAVVVAMNAYGNGKVRVNTGLPVVDHLITSLGFWALFDLDIDASPVVPGRTSYDEGHHLCEDTGWCLGKALHQNLIPVLQLSSYSIIRFGQALVPMDDALVYAAVDISGRPYFAQGLGLNDCWEGSIPLNWMLEFMRLFALASQLNLHLGRIRGHDPHHIMESAFKATGLALRMAIKPDKGRVSVASTKGVIG